MRVLTGYFFRTIAGTTLLVMAVFLSLGAFIEFVSQLDDVGEGDYSLPRVFVWVLLGLPQIVFELLPVAVLLGALLGLGTLASRSELVVLRSAGLSPAGMARAVLVTGLGLALLTALLGDWIAPPLERYARQYRALAKFGQEGLGAGQSAWIREGELIVNVAAPDGAGDPGGVWLYRIGESGSLAALGRADSMEIGQQGEWRLLNYAESVIGPDGIETRREAASGALAGINPELLSLTVVRPDSMMSIALWRYAQYLRRNGLDARNYEVAFWSRVAHSAAVPFMCILAVPFVLGPLRSGGAGARLLLGFGIGLAWFLLNRTLVDGGAIWNLHPVLVGWLPTALLALVTAWAVSRAR